MAIYHLSVKSISRSAGRSVVAAAAYRAGQELTDERQGLTHDYTRKQGVEDAFIVAPDGADWAQDRNALWNAAEAAEKRKDAKTGREYELALPAELDAGARKELARDFAAELVERYGVVADVAIHEPGREGDNRNHHAHILTTTRTAGADGLGAKTRVLDVASTASGEIERLREVWARQVNQALERHQVEQRVDHRSFERQGNEQEPTRHMGVSATALERQAGRENPGREPVTDLGKQNAEIRERNRVLETARKAVEKAQELFSGLEKRARLAVGLARKIGQRMEREREAERQRKELARQAEIRREMQRQQDIRAAEEARKAAEMERQKRRAKEIEQPTFRRSRDRGPSIGF
ncbi:MobA/MobL family protein [Gluconobacter sp. LMG 1744]|uniref:MobQ family relaxase n=1 Tax=Gluconobacter cadivus TaxID=2728101 RepID=UPI001884CCCA|nr:MobQ family relaxase [Gluconobacter cadivus]MBF0892790.1 MobA/MobL family protein [Gluconobacter cadivus]